LCGIILSRSKRNSIKRCSIIFNEVNGIYLIGSGYNTISGNTVDLNKNAGIDIAADYIWGGSIPSVNNIVQYNIISKNDIGILISSSPYEGDYYTNNTFFKNNIIRNKVQAFTLISDKNIWQNNYWNRPRIFPKCIFGFPFIDFDWRPALKPYDIEVSG
jgi:hypothetical protein